MDLRANTIAGVIGLSLFLVCPLPGAAGNLCALDAATSQPLATLTTQGSARLLEAASQAFRVFEAAETAPASLHTPRAATVRLLDEATKAYKEALGLTAELERADTFLRGRPFDRLRAAFGITPGTLGHTRWEIIVRTAQTSKTPAADLIRVCVAGAETLKYTMSTLTPETPPSLLRRAASTWFSVLSHAELVSDAFDSLVR